MKHGSLFSGIGGFDLAAEWMGWENVFHCEWNEFGQKVLHHYWPNAESFDDITKTDFTKYANQIDILTGGFPCQPYSMAGKRQGKEDERHLWPQMLRAIREIKPKYIVGENVFGLLNWNGGMVFDEVHTDLEFEGYEVQAVVIPAAAVNAPHGRDRVWFVATNTKNIGSPIGKLGESQTKQQIQARGNIDGFESLGIATDTNRISDWGGSKQPSAAHKQGWSGETNSGIGNEGEQQSIRDITSEGDATNPECNGLEHGDKARNIRSKETTPCGKGGEPTNDIATNGGGNVTDADLPRFKTKGEQSESTTQNKRIEHSRSGWEQFPTQSPICGGDDGIPTELDGITFSKWRNESIKAYGNAIVPQVAYEIFKAIQRTI